MRLSKSKTNLTLIEEQSDVLSIGRSGFLLAILANVIWGASFLASKYTLEAWGPFTASSMRFGIATIVLFIALMLTGKKIVVPSTRNQWLNIFIVGTTGFGLLYPLQLAGLQFISSGMSSAIMLTSPLIVIVLSFAVIGEKLSTQKLIALSLGVIGGSILLSQKTSAIQLNDKFTTGAILTLGASLSLAASIIFTRKATKEMGPASVTLLSMAVGFLELTISAFIFEENVLASITGNASLISWMALLFLALVCSAFCFFIWNAALAISSPQEIASSMHVKTPTAVLIGIGIAGEQVTLQVILGTTIVTLGVWLSQQKTLLGRSK